MRLGLVLVGLVGVNIYVFFFNRGTAPREILNVQSTSKTMDGARQEALAADAKKGKELVVAANGPGAPVPRAKSSAPGTAAPTPVGAARVASPTFQPAQAPVIRVPYAPPPEPIAVRAPAQRPVIQIPFAPPPEEEADTQIADVEKQFNPNDTLGQVLAREGFGSAAPKVIAAMAKLVDPKTIRGGQRYIVRMGEDGTPAAFEYQPSAASRYVVERALQETGEGGEAEANGQWSARKLEADIELRTVEVAGVVESSLYESVHKAGESTSLVSLLVELFAWDVNFYIDTHPGDHWKVIVEKQYLSGQFYKYGRLLAAEYGGKVGTFRAFFWAGKDAGREKPGKYYDEHGLAVTKTMLKTPLRFVRISSKFDRKRLHPILHVERAHLGIDYAAPVGTPVWASAGGRVAEAAFKRGSGNTVVLAHSNGLSTRYYHLSKFARGLRVGQLVRQKDVIGFVGTTGLSTGPHLHFSVTRNGSFVDPSKLQVNRDPSVPDRAAFLAAIRPRIAALKAIVPSTVARN